MINNLRTCVRSKKFILFLKKCFIIVIVMGVTMVFLSLITNTEGNNRENRKFEVLVKDDSSRLQLRSLQEQNQDSKRKLSSYFKDYTLSHNDKKTKREQQNLRVNSSGVDKLISERAGTVHTWPWGKSTREIEACRQKEYNVSSLPKASVVISFHDSEKLINIMHTIQSILNRTPGHLLHEIILIDDNTKNEDFQGQLEKYITKDEKTKSAVKLIRLKQGNESPAGLIKARLEGIKQVQSPAFVVLDSHVEVQQQWLEPLLFEIKRNRHVLASSYLDWIRPLETDKWSYKHGPSTWKTVFDWTFTFGFQDIPTNVKANREDLTAPIESPVTVGTFAMDKGYFLDVGGFDSGMQKWGGENIDLPLRVWLNGGRVINVPCSHVAHMEERGSRMYRQKWTDEVQGNYKRVAEVWLDEYSKYLYWYLPHIKEVQSGNKQNRKKLKENFKYNFAWYLENVFPELGIPDKDSLAYGQVQNLGSNGCLNVKWITESVRMSRDCFHKDPGDVGIFWNRKGELRLPIHVINYNGNENDLSLKEYVSLFNTTGISHWIHWKDGPFLETKSRMCLQADLSGQFPYVTYCNFTNLHQKWTFNHYTADYKRLGVGSVNNEKESFSHLMWEVITNVKQNQSSRLKTLAKMKPEIRNK